MIVNTVRRAVAVAHIHGNPTTLVTMFIISRAAATLVLSVASSVSLVAQTPRDGNAVLERMKTAYDGKWYHTLTFGQKTTQIRRDGSSNVATWHESLRHTSATGVQLRIDMGELADGNGVLYTTDSSWRVQKGALSATRADGNEFLPLIEGVYVQPVAKTAAEIARMHVDMSRVRPGSWHDRSVWVVGASSASDTTSAQFWVDQARKVVVRAILRPDTATTMDISLDGYEPVGPAWLATKITMAVNGKVIQTEEYYDWKTNVDLPPALFDVKTWSTAPHWAKK
jgi:hypothetical protein